MFRIDQAGLTTGVSGRSRTDGLLNGALVTLTNTSGGTTLFRLLWVAVGDTTAVASLAPNSPGSNVWTFSPTANRPGTYRIELIKDQGLPTESKRELVFRVRTAVRGIAIPALNERADPKASLLNNGPEVVEASADNATDYGDAALAALDYAGWLRAVHELIVIVDAITGGGGSAVVNNVAAGLAPATTSAPFASVLGYTGGAKTGAWVVPRDARIYPVGSGYGQYATIHDALAAIAAGTAPSRDDRAQILVYPGLYTSVTPYVIPAFVEVAGVSKFTVELYNTTTDLFDIQGDNVHFTNFLIRGAPAPSLVAFRCNDHSAIHVRYVDMLHNNELSTQKFLVQSGSNWKILFLEHLVIDSWRTTAGYLIQLSNTASAARFCDVIVNDVFADTFHLTDYGGEFLLEGCQDVRFGDCTLRGIAVYHTAVYVKRLSGQTGTPEFLMRNSYCQGAVTLWAEANCSYTLVNSDCVGANTPAGTRTVRNSAT
jgi:hypothetical protein